MVYRAKAIKCLSNNVEENLYSLDLEKYFMGWGCNSVVEYLSSMQKTLVISQHCQKTNKQTNISWV
jgi:hypothetical protein